MKSFKEEKGYVPFAVVANIAVILIVTVGMAASVSFTFVKKKAYNVLDRYNNVVSTVDNNIVRNTTVNNNTVRNTAVNNNIVRNTTVNNNPASIEVRNKVFEEYETISGETRSSQEIRALEREVESNNAAHSDHQIVLTYTEGTTLSVQSRYTVNLKYDDEHFINEIIITKAE